MATTIKCNKCGNIIEVSEALKKELETQIIKEAEEKYKREIQDLKEKEKEFERNKEVEIEKIKTEIFEKAKDDAISKVRKEYDYKINSTKQEAEEKDKQNRELQDQLSQLMKELREARDTESKLKIQFEKDLLAEQDKIKQNAKKEAEEELNLKIASKDKQLADLEKQLKEAQRKASQGSQQLQGEVAELVLEDLLKTNFQFDEISEVPKGISGADVIQIVKNNSMFACGTIVWESKNTKNWTQGWVSKLKEDSRKLKADVSILVSAVIPEDIKGFGLVDGVWVCDVSLAIPLAFTLRDKLISVKNSQEANKGKASKSEIVYNYLISNEFRQRLEVWIEYFKDRREEVEKERAYFMKKWEKEDKNILKVFQNTAGMYGDLQGLIGGALPKVQYLELPESE